MSKRRLINYLLRFRMFRKNMKSAFNLTRVYISDLAVYNEMISTFSTVLDVLLNRKSFVDGNSNSC